MIISFIPMTILFDLGVMPLGEIRCLGSNCLVKKKQNILSGIHVGLCGRIFMQVVFLLQNHEALTADCHSLGDTLNLSPPPRPRPISTPPLIFDCQPPSWYKFLSLPSLPLPLKSKMAAMIFVKKIQSTPRQNYASSAGQLISRSQVFRLVTMRMPACVTNGNLSL